MRELVEELNTKLFDNGVFNYGLVYITDGFADIIQFNEITLWHSEEDFDDISQEQIKKKVIDNFNNYVNEINQLKFNYGKSEDSSSS